MSSWYPILLAWSVACTNYSLTMHMGILRLINLANGRLWLVLSNASDAYKKAENTGVSLLT